MHAEQLLALIEHNVQLALHILQAFGATPVFK